MTFISIILASDVAPSHERVKILTRYTTTS